MMVHLHVATSNPTKWYYAVEDKRQGPISFEELRDLANNGSLVRDDLVWKKGMSNWEPAGTIQGLFPIAPPSAPSVLAVQATAHAAQAPTSGMGTVKGDSKQPPAPAKQSTSKTFLVVVAGIAACAVLALLAFAFIWRDKHSTEAPSAALPDAAQNGSAPTAPSRPSQPSTPTSSSSAPTETDTAAAPAETTQNGALFRCKESNGVSKYTNKPGEGQDCEKVLTYVPKSDENSAQNETKANEVRVFRCQASDGKMVFTNKPEKYRECVELSGTDQPDQGGSIANRLNNVQAYIDNINGPPNREGSIANRLNNVQSYIDNISGPPDREGSIASRLNNAKTYIDNIDGPGPHTSNAVDQGNKGGQNFSPTRSGGAAAPGPDSVSGGGKNCSAYASQPSSPEEEVVVALGQKLVGRKVEYRPLGGTARGARSPLLAIEAATGYDQNCDPDPYQVYIFHEGVLLGTASKTQMHPKSDGYIESMKFVDGEHLQIDFSKGPRCCPKGIDQRTLTLKGPDGAWRAEMPP